MMVIASLDIAEIQVKALPLLVGRCGEEE